MTKSRIWIIRAKGAIAFGLLWDVACAQSLPPDILQCADVRDSSQRLECFDQQVARYKASANSGAASPSSGTANRGVTPGANLPQPLPASPPPSAATSGSPATAKGAATPSTPESAPASAHLTARITSVKGTSDDVVVTLDNGQVWEQVQEASADLNLRPGKLVTIDRQMGSYWLSNADGAVMKVRQTQ